MGPSRCVNPLPFNIPYYHNASRVHPCECGCIHEGRSSFSFSFPISCVVVIYKYLEFRLPEYTTYTSPVNYKTPKSGVKVFEVYIRTSIQKSRTEIKVGSDLKFISISWLIIKQILDAFKDVFVVLLVADDDAACRSMFPLCSRFPP